MGHLIERKLTRVNGEGPQMTKDPSWPRAQGAVEKVANPVHGQAAAPHHCVEGQCEMGGLLTRIANLTAKCSVLYEALEAVESEICLTGNLKTIVDEALA